MTTTPRVALFVTCLVDLIRPRIGFASIAALEERLKKRASDAPEEIQKRLGIARKEIAQWNNFDYLLISTSIPEDLRRMLAIVEAEKSRAARSQPPEL